MEYKKLEDMPNLGAVAARKLRASGVGTPGELCALGSREAFFRVRAKADPEACISMLYALEGAVQGIRWHVLPQEERQALLAFYNTL